MAFKMKGFPLRSGFAHTVNIDKHEHVDATGGPESKEQGSEETNVDTRNTQQKIDRLNRELGALMKWWNSDARTKYPAAVPSTKRRIAEIKEELAALGG